MATIAAERESAHSDLYDLTYAFQRFEDLSGPESRAAVYSQANRVLVWRESSLYITGITPMPISPFLDMARRRAIWEAVTPLAFLCAGMLGLATSTAGVSITLSVMALVLVTTATVGRLVWPS